jgi:hypothetical protein
MLSHTGWNYIRTDLLWESIETKKGIYDFSAYDVLVADLVKRNIKALFILDYGNILYDGGLSLVSSLNLSDPITLAPPMPQLEMHSLISRWLRYLITLDLDSCNIKFYSIS